MGDYSQFEDKSSFQLFLTETPLFFKLFAGLMIVLFISAILFVIIKSVSTWSSNQTSELLKRRCIVVDKRSEVWGGSGDSSATTSYYVTFEFNDTSRIELPIRDDRYGLIVVGDQGEVIYQGTRFKDFIRL